MSFGSVDPLSTTPADTTATITVNCTGMPSGSNTAYCLGFGPGSGGYSGSLRLMTGPSSATYPYTFFADGGRSYAWGSRNYTALGYAYGQVSNTSTVSTTATLYGRMATGYPSRPTGSYSSTLSGSNDALLYTLSGGSTDCNNGPVASTPQATTSFTVTATLQADCIINGTSNVSFGVSGPIVSNVYGTGSVGVQCTSALPYTIGLSNGGTGTGPTARKMTGSGGSITYGLYQDSGYSQPWGATSGTMISGTGTGSSIAYSVYGRVPPQATPAAGSYSDTVNVTVTY